MILCSSTVRSEKPLEEAMGDISAAGFNYIDLLVINTWAHINPADLVKDFKGVVSHFEDVMQKSDLKVGAVNVGLNHNLYDRRADVVESNIRELDAVCRFMNFLGVDVAALQPMKSDPSRSLEKVVKDCIKSLSEYLECADKYGVTLGLELHAHSPFESIEAMKYLFTELPKATIAYDPTHVICMGYSLKECEFVMDRASHVHIRNASKGNFLRSFEDGEVDFEWIIKTLMEKGYKGNYSIESLQNDEFDAIEDALKIKDLLEKLLA